LTDYKAIRENPLTHLDYFVEWGGWPWRRFVRVALDDFIGHDLSGLNVLDVGTRSGRMACLFALLGARAVGIDKTPGSDERAGAEAERLGVADRTEFIVTDGSLDALAGRSFDLVFTKSLLVLVPGLPDFLKDVDALLKPGGRVCFIENGYGNFLVNAFRPLRHNWDWRQARYFTDREIKLLGEVFETALSKFWAVPPIYLYCGTKKRQ
jgi:SAM-dependent methyltransferase